MVVIDLSSPDDADATRDRRGCDDGGRLESDASDREAAERYATAGGRPAADDRRGARRTDRGQARCRRSARCALEEREREGEGKEGKALERAALLALGHLEARAGRAFRDVIEEPLALLARNSAVELPREAELGAIAGRRVLELVGEGAAGAEKEGLERSLGEVEGLCDLVVRPPLELSQHERLTLVLGDPLQRANELLHRRPVALLRLLGDLADELHLGRARLLLAEPLAHDVVRDRDQPVRRLPWPLAALEGAEGVDERGLRHVLGVGMVAEDGVGIAIHLCRMAAVEVVEGTPSGDHGFCCGHSD